MSFSFDGSTNAKCSLNTATSCGFNARCKTSSTTAYVLISVGWWNYN